MMRSCFSPINSCNCCASVLSLIAAQPTTPARMGSSIQSNKRRLGCRRGNEAGGNTSTTVASFNGELTDFPHFKQNCAESGKVAPHLLHPSNTFAGGSGALFVGILSGSQQSDGNANHRGEMPANISTG